MNVLRIIFIITLVSCGAGSKITFVDGANTNYAVKIDKRFVYDLNGNVMESDFSFSFTDN